MMASWKEEEVGKRGIFVINVPHFVSPDGI